jgi:hypothetical protein
MRGIGLLLFLGISLHLGAQTTFTYQGHLKDGTNLANGSFDFRFTLFGGGGGGIELAPSQLTTPITVSDGNFNAALDFGNVFDGGARWLEIGVKPSGSRCFHHDSKLHRRPRRCMPRSPMRPELLELLRRRNCRLTSPG